VTNPTGTRLETAVVRWMREHGWPFARRLAKEGAKDKGDVTLGDGLPVTIECKARKKFDLAEAIRELEAEMENAGVPYGYAILKRRGTTDVGKYYAVLPVSVLNDLLRAHLQTRVVQPHTRRRLIPRAG
jgi:hypothetical protein